MVRVEEQVYLMMEYMSLGSVKSGMKWMDGNVRNMLDVAAQSAAGMIHLHDKGIMHRDLALRNILFASSGNGFLAKVADFGMSRATDEGHRMEPPASCPEDIQNLIRQMWETDASR
eukprot:TRINITY_DN691_c0_g1_i4.p2 TRINITY_DN691_c0_g1~~TRINITY_DN691_c0_g1_i4.p2  ORF type:complete len:123 (+),score=29.61 TRINITY_DN691_c0_g1_i4:24-371(+)